MNKVIVLEGLTETSAYQSWKVPPLDWFYRNAALHVHVSDNICKGWGLGTTHAIPGPGVL